MSLAKSKPAECVHRRSGFPRLSGRSGLVPVELALVTLMMLTLTSIASPALNALMVRSRHARLTATLREAQVGVDLFYAVTSRYPVNPDYAESITLLDFTAIDAGGKLFVPRYLKHIPDQKPFSYGLNPADGPYVYFGVTPLGVVFATQRPPEDGIWADMEVAPDDNNAQPEIFEIHIAASAVEASTGSIVTITASPVTRDLRPVCGVDLLFTIEGSLTGTSSQKKRTDASGTCSIEISSVEPQVITVTASVTGS